MARLPSVHPRDDFHQGVRSDGRDRARAGSGALVRRAISTRKAPASTATTAVRPSTGSADQPTPTMSATIAEIEISPTLVSGA